MQTRSSGLEASQPRLRERHICYRSLVWAIRPVDAAWFEFDKHLGFEPGLRVENVRISGSIES